MKKSLSILFSLGLIMSLSTYLHAEDKKGVKKDDKKLALKDVPAAAQKTIELQSKGWNIKKIWTEKENGAIEYNALIVKGENETKEIAVAADGKFLGSEEPIKLSDVPEAARNTIEKQTKGHKIKELEKATDENGKIIYEFVLKDKKGEVGVNLDGTMAPAEK